MIGFRANFGGPDFPNIPDEQYTTLLYDTLAFDEGACFNKATGEWCPDIETPSLVSLGLQTWLDAGAGGQNAQFVSKVVKSNSEATPPYETVDVIAPIGVLCAQPGVAIVGGSGIDLCKPGDRYKVILWANSATGPTGLDTVNGNPAHTWFSGAVIE